jgi:cytochrome c-type biogenesis protein CcmH/NrfG
MDAHELKPVPSHGVRPLVVCLVVTWLAAVLAFGLWQAYGAWLLGGGSGRAF